MDLDQSEIGPLVAGDWIAAVTPLLRDISPSAAQWWSTVLHYAGSAYQCWLKADPLARLRILPGDPPEFEKPPLLRIEQRGQTLH